MNTTRQSKHAGFTLVEILVVIAVIGVLSAIILSVFSLVRGKARQTACSSNLKQLYAAFALYANDNNGMMPRFSTIENITIILDGKDIPSINEADKLIAAMMPYTRSNSGLWKCPDDGLAASARTPADPHYYTGYYYHSFRDVSRHDQWHPMPLEYKYQFPSSDGAWPLMRDDYQCPGEKGHFHHGWFNELYHDGHVEAQKQWYGDNGCK